MQYAHLALASVVALFIAGPGWTQQVQPPAQEPPAPLDEEAPDPVIGTMPCREFVELSPEEQMTAMSDAKVAPGEALEEPSPASEQAAAATVATCTVNPDLPLIEAIRLAVPE